MNDLPSWQRPCQADAVRVIVVDDEPDLREMIAEYLLGKRDFLVRTVGDVRELDAHLAEDPPDVLILDVNMPGEDGFSIARRVRAGSTVPILTLTAVSEPVDRVVALELGADDYLAKPFDLRELRARIHVVLRRTGRTAALEKLAMIDPLTGVANRCHFEMRAAVEITESRRAHRDSH